MLPHRGDSLGLLQITATRLVLESLIELAAAGVLIWWLRGELRHGRSFAESVERSASRIGGALLFAPRGPRRLAEPWNKSRFRES